MLNAAHNSLGSIIITRSTGTVHTSTNVCLTSVTISVPAIWQIGLRSPPKFNHLFICTTFPENFMQSSLKFLRKVASKQTNKQKHNLLGGDDNEIYNMNSVEQDMSSRQVDNRQTVSVSDQLTNDERLKLMFKVANTAKALTMVGISFRVLGKQQQQQLSGTTWVSRYQKKHSPTHHPDHHPIFISFFHLLRFIASSLFKLLAWQSWVNSS